ncbi:MAG: glycogen synthase, partial [Oscillospiraceae bacterium]|nr:glycogen synthase [Oscillospiraceae bacterium]
MKVLYVTSEAHPFAASGGLADVAGSLPSAMRQRLVGARVVMPLYEAVPQELRDQMTFVTSLSVPVAWRRQYCGVFEARANGVVYYLLDNQYYFKRKGLYGHYDDAERFAFFSRAVLEMLPYIDFKPDVVNANDWQSALVPVYYDLFYCHNEWYHGIKTVFTIHNIQYQGQYGLELLEEVLGIPRDKSHVVEYEKCVNMMKGAIETAHAVTTVSPTYAGEILDPWFAHHLDPILSQRQWKLSGILNGIDTDGYNPATDPDVYEKYDIDNFIEGKAKNKAELQKRLGLPERPEVPMISMVTRMVPHKGLDLVRQSLETLLSGEDVQFVTLGSGDWEYETFFKEMQKKYPDKLCSCYGYIPELSRKIYAASDIFLMPSKSEPCGLSQMISLRYGTIPVVRETGGLKDSITDSGDNLGNGFTFQKYDADDMLNAIRRALEGFAVKEGWEVLVRRAMES